ncbi:MAG: coproporphyrinogen-III oxidase family protein [Gemmatimonadota bacterium]
MSGPLLSRGSVPHLYLHVPFCRRLCPYCDFAVTPGNPPDPERWADALRRECAIWEARGVLLDRVETLLVGGGTPSLLGIGAMAGVQAIVGRSRLGSIREWTAEANPEDVTPDLLEGWMDAGVTRVSVGLQSLRSDALAFLGRAHGVEEGYRAMDRCAASGLESWSVDLLFGLPPEIDPDPLDTLRQAVDRGVPHVSLYELTAEPDTTLGREVASGRLEMASGDLRADQYLGLADALDAAGYAPYEMTSFALPKHDSAHARAVLDGGPWLGLGPGAHSRLGGHRSWNLRDWMGYLGSVMLGELPMAGSEADQAEDEQIEALWFRLRSAEGVEFGALGPEARRLHRGWVERGLALEGSDRLRLTPRGWLRLDELAVDLARTEAKREAPFSGL